MIFERTGFETRRRISEGRRNRRHVAGELDQRRRAQEIASLRGIVAPLVVGVTRARRRTDSEGDIMDDNYGRRFESLGELVVNLAEKIGADEPVGTVA